MSKSPTPTSRQARREAARRAAPRPRPAVWLLSAFAAALAAVIVFAVVHPRPGAGPAVGSGPIPADVAHNLTQIPDEVWNGARSDGVARLQLVPGHAPAQKPPLVLYIGAEYCPYCAALRWPLVAALARFGTFTGLELSLSSATDAFPDTPTLTMLHAHYRSPYLTLQTVELEGNVADASGRYPPLQKTTPEQMVPFNKLDPGHSIPFLMIGGRYYLTESPFSPGLLATMDWRAVSASLQFGSSPAAQAILGTANEIAAAVCAVDGGAPAAVCGSAGVRNGAQPLPRPAP
jgi:hypothetical protein